MAYSLLLGKLLDKPLKIIKKKAETWDVESIVKNSGKQRMERQVQYFLAYLDMH